MIDCQTGIVLHKYKAPGEVSAGALLVRDCGQSAGVGGPGSATRSPGDSVLPGFSAAGLTLQAPCARSPAP